MIHSLAGGRLREQQLFDFVKLEFENNPNHFFWFISEIKDLRLNDYVLAPFGPLDELQKAKVVRVDKNVISTSAPLPLKRMKKITKKI